MSDHDPAFYGMSFAAVGGVAVTLFAWALASAPSRPAARLGVRGLKRQRAIHGTAFSSIEPLVRWAGVRLSGILPERVYSALDRALVASGDYLGLTPEEYVALMVLGIGFGLGCGGLYHAVTSGSVVCAAILAVSGGMLPYMQVARESERRARQITRGLPYVIDVMALSMSAGLDFPAAVRQVVLRSSDRSDALTEELERVLHELSLGHTRKMALEAFADRTVTVASTEFVSAVVQSEERGNPLAETLTIQASVSRMRRSMRAEEQAARSATTIYLPLGLLMLSVLLLVGGPLVLRMQEVMGK